MKKTLSLLAVMLLMSLVSLAAVKKTNLKVLYVGGHSDIETFGADYDKEANAKSIVARTAAWESYLKEYFTTVKTVQGSDYNYKMSYDYDVTIIDGDPKPLEPRKMVSSNGKFDKIVYAKYFPDDFDRPVITIADESETVGRRMGVKNDWYCLCLLGHAYGLNTKNAIFQGPYPVTLTMESRPTPSGAREYAGMVHETLPELTPMWLVHGKDYGNTKGYKVGMVTRPWGYLDSPDTEVISGGESAKSYDAIAIGRHANWLHWGFAASPADMTDEAKPVFANAVVYISKFAGHRIIARKLNEGIATRVRADEMKYQVSRETYEAYKAIIDESNKAIAHAADSLKQLQTAGKELSSMEQQYIAIAEHPQQVPSYLDYVKERAGELYKQFGTDVDKYAAYYSENKPYFYGSFDDYGLKLDEDAKSLGLSNNDKRLLDKAISLWEQGTDVEKAKRILYRYTLLRYDNAKDFRAWFKKYQQKLFFTESGGWLWLVNDTNPKTPGNDYSVLKYNDIDESTIAPMKNKATREDPVALSYAVTREGSDGGEITIRMKIFSGYHIYSVVSDEDPYIETKYEWQTEGDVQLDGEMQKPAGKLMNGSKSIIFEGEQVLRQRFTGKQGKVKLTVSYQACDEHACLMPMTKTLEIEI